MGERVELKGLQQEVCVLYIRQKKTNELKGKGSGEKTVLCGIREGLKSS